MNATDTPAPWILTALGHPDADNADADAPGPVGRRVLIEAGDLSGTAAASCLNRNAFGFLLYSALGKLGLLAQDHGGAFWAILPNLGDADAWRLLGRVVEGYVHGDSPPADLTAGDPRIPGRLTTDIASTFQAVHSDADLLRHLDAPEGAQEGLDAAQELTVTVAPQEGRHRALCYPGGTVPPGAPAILPPGAA